MAIKYVNVINSFVSTEGSAGIMTNYVYYTLLVVKTDGSSEIVEGRLNQVANLLRYVRTPVDELQELKETVKGLRKDMNDLVERKMTCVVDSFFPIPPIGGLGEAEAVERLTEAGLEPVFLNGYPQGTPANGYVESFARNEGNFKKVDLLIRHRTPQVQGVEVQEALSALTEAGFTADVTRKVVSGVEDGVVLRCTRPDEDRLHVCLEVSDAVPETRGMNVRQAVKALQEAGYEATVEKKVVAGVEPGEVIVWKTMAPRKIRLTCAIPQVYHADSVSVQAADAREPAEDVYTAAARFNNESLTLFIDLSYTLGSKTKRQITGVKNPLSARAAALDAWTLEPGEGRILHITLPFERSFDDLPESLTLELETQFGLMKKKETLPLTFVFRW